jgi:hypothetical protein
VIYIGIDPGLTGAVAFLGDDSGPRVEDIPTVVTGAGTVKCEVDAHGLAALLGGWEPLVRKAVLERTQSMPTQGVATMFSMGVSRGVIKGVLGTLGIPYIEVAPATWKKAYGLGADKEKARAIAIQRYPALAASLARVKDHNRAEAVLLADWLANSEQRRG